MLHACPWLPSVLLPSPSNVCPANVCDVRVPAALPVHGVFAGAAAWALRLFRRLQLLALQCCAACAC